MSKGGESVNIALGTEADPEAKCPDCAGPLAHRSGCVECPVCGFTACAN